MWLMILCRIKSKPLDLRSLFEEKSAGWVGGATPFPQLVAVELLLVRNDLHLRGTKALYFIHRLLQLFLLLHY